MVTVDNRSVDNDTKSDIGFKLGRCSRCNSTNLIISDEKIICNHCNNWTWLDDAKHSCWNGYIVEQNERDDKK